MAGKYKSTEYMYSSARLRSLEARIATREQQQRLADMDSAAAICAVLPDYGFEIKQGSDGIFDREATLMSVVEAGMSTVREMECAEAVDFLGYVYDCNNIKTIIKCALRGISPDGMLMPLGTVTPEDMKAAFANKDYALLPRAMRKAVPEAEAAYAATGNPQKIDFIIDRACFEDMNASAEKSGIDLAVRIAAAKTDTANILLTLRLLRMRLGVQGRALFDEAFAEVGENSSELLFGKALLCECLEVGEDRLAEVISAKYPKLSELVAAGAPLNVIEKVTDDMIMGIVKEAKFIPFGAEIAIAYTVALEYEVKNIRIILAGKEAGLSRDIICERLRESYV